MKAGPPALQCDLDQCPSVLQCPVLNLCCSLDARRWADVLVVAPLSANTLAKVAMGLCDNLLTCVIRAWDWTEAPLLVGACNQVKLTRGLGSVLLPQLCQPLTESTGTGPNMHSIFKSMPVRVRQKLGRYAEWQKLGLDHGIRPAPGCCLVGFHYVNFVHILCRQCLEEMSHSRQFYLNHPTSFMVLLQGSHSFLGHFACLPPRCRLRQCQTLAVAFSPLLLSLEQLKKLCCSQVAPAMNTVMWLSPFTEQHLSVSHEMSGVYNHPSCMGHYAHWDLNVVPLLTCSLAAREQGGRQNKVQSLVSGV